MSKNILQEAIADAKMIRETALKNAKNALEETLKPKLEKMMSKKLNEMDEFGNDELEEDVDLSSILQELEDDLNEVEDDDDSDKSEKKEKDDKKTSPKKTDDKSPSKTPKPKEKEGSEKDEDDKSDEKISDMTVDEFTSLIQSVVSQEINADATGDGLGMGDDLDGMPGDDLGGDDLGGDEFGMGDDLGGDEFGGDDLGGGMPGAEDEDEFNIDEILDELENMGKPAATAPSVGLNENKKLKRKLIEAYKAVKVLRTEINEINLLNAKLLYVNKIFKAKNLNEGQKLKVISSFDRATSVKEVKLIFEALGSNLLSPVNPNKKATIKENLGFASKPSGMSRKPILEVNESLSRMQVLAGIKNK